VRVAIIDDDDIVRSSLKTILEASGIDVCGLGSNGVDAIEIYRNTRPDILLSDIRMEEMTGIEAATAIIKEFPEAKILFLTTFSDDEYVACALQCNAKGYILKQDFQGIVPALQAVYSGQSVFGGEIIHKIPNIQADVKPEDYEERNITDKEYEIIKLVAEGMSNKEIAANVYLSEGTVRNYLSNILEKLQVRDRTQLVVYYYKNKR